MPFFDDEGREVSAALFPKPALCAGCRLNDDPSQTIACTLTRLDQYGETEFICFAYTPISGSAQE